MIFWNRIPGFYHNQRRPRVPNPRGTENNALLNILLRSCVLSYLMYNYVSPADSAVTVSSYIPSALCVQSGWVGGLSSCGGGRRAVGGEEYL